MAASTRDCSGICRPVCSASRSAISLAAVGRHRARHAGRPIGLGDARARSDLPGAAHRPAAGLAAAVARRVPRQASPSAIFVIFITSIWPIIINTAVGIRNIPQDYRNVARCCSSIRSSSSAKIMIPAAAPYIFTGLRIGIGLSWLAIVAAEMLIGGVGIGFFIWDAWNSSRIRDIIVALVYVGIDRLRARPHGRRRSARSSPAAHRQAEGAHHGTSYLKIDHVDEELHPRQRLDVGGAAATSTSTIEQGRVRLHHRPFRLRQVDPAQPRRRSDRARPQAAVLLEDREVDQPGTGPRGGVPEPQPAALAHGLRERAARGRQGVRRRARSRAERHAWTMHNLDLVQMSARQGQAAVRKSPAA